MTNIAPMPSIHSICSSNEKFSAPSWVKRDCDPQSWSMARKCVARVIYANFANSESNIFDSFIGIVIVFNIILMIVETDPQAQCDEDTKYSECLSKWVVVANYVLLLIYLVELFMRLFVHRCMFFFAGVVGTTWNILDLTIVVFGIAGLFLQDAGGDVKKVQILRIIRVARVLRVAKLINRFPTLRNFIKGFTGAIIAMLWGLVLILIMLIIWSILAVEFVHKVNQDLYLDDDEWCAQAFSSVSRATLLFFQTLVAGDSWGACAIPVINKEPWLYCLFALALVSVQLGFTNLVLAIIVDKAADAREESKAEKLQKRKDLESKSVLLWREVMQRMDTDHDCTLTLPEIMSGFQDPKIKDVLETMTFAEKDIEHLFHLMDADGSGAVSYDEFVDCFYKAQTQDQRAYLMIMRLQLNRLETRMSQQFEQMNAALCNRCVQSSNQYCEWETPAVSTWRRNVMRQKEENSLDPQLSFELVGISDNGEDLSSDCIPPPSTMQNSVARLFHAEAEHTAAPPWLPAVANAATEVAGRVVEFEDEEEKNIFAGFSSGRRLKEQLEAASVEAAESAAKLTEQIAPLEESTSWSQPLWVQGQQLVQPDSPAHQPGGSLGPDSWCAHDSSIHSSGSGSLSSSAHLGLSAPAVARNVPLRSPA